MVQTGTGMGINRDPLPRAEFNRRVAALKVPAPDASRRDVSLYLLDFFRLRFGDFTFRHLLTSAKKAMDDGHEEKVVVACLLHDISNGCLIRSDHGYWGAQMIAPYVSEEIAWAACGKGNDDADRLGWISLA